MKRVLFFYLFLLSISCNSFASEDLSGTICSTNDCYTIIKQLGEGAFGKVYAVENSQGQPFAIKTYKEALDKSNPLNFFSDGLREFLRGQLLSHPNIIKSHDFFMSDSEEGIAHIVLDLVDGKALYQTERGEIEASDLQIVIMQFIDALRYAFAMNLMHLDLHTGNLMLDKDSNIMVIDLASFFTLEEVQAYLFRKIAPASYTKENKSSAVNPQIDETAAANTVLVPESSVIPMAPLRIAKLEKFFNENPDILKETKEVLIDQEIKEAVFSLKSKKVTDFSKNASIIAGVKSRKTTPKSPASIDLKPFQAHYFDRITEICLSLISKAEGQRDEKIEMRTNIKKIAWNYEEDRVEGIDLPFETYLDQLFISLKP